MIEKTWGLQLSPNPESRIGAAAFISKSAVEQKLYTVSQENTGLQLQHPAYCTVFAAAFRKSAPAAKHLGDISVPSSCGGQAFLPI